MYEHILLASDLIKANKPTERVAIEQAKQANAKLFAVYVIEPISTYGFPLVVDVGIEGEKHARKAVAELGEELKIDSENLYVRVGSPKQEVLKLAKEINADLIVVGSHGRHGLSALLGSTAIGVLHGSECDVLIVKAYDK